jgi:hypothetical protein
MLGHKEGTPDNLERNEMDVGPPQTRPKSTNPRRKVEMTFHLDDTQKAIFVAWYEDTLVQGSLEWTHFLPDQPTVPITFKFNKAPIIDSISFNLWKIKYDVWYIRKA